MRTVVLVVEHSDDGALGLVLNRPSESTVGEAVPELMTLTDPEDEVLVGGPVGQSAVIVLADFEDPDEAALIAFDSVGVMAGGGPSEEFGNGVRRARIFAGDLASSTASSSAATGSSSRPDTPTRSPPSPPSSGARCWNVRVGATRWLRACRPIRRLTRKQWARIRTPAG